MAFVRLFLFAVLSVTGVLSVPVEPLADWEPPFDGARDVTFYLYTQSNKETPQFLKLDDDSESSNFNPNNPTRFVIHGWTASVSAVDGYREAYIATGNEYNIVLVDWSGPASVGKLEVANSSIVVGDYVGQLINQLIESRGLSPDDVHIIGHSIGAHVAALAGRKVGGKVSEVVALDVANDAYDGAVYVGLVKSDAKFIQVMHTSAVSFGLLDSQGHVDFFPNGGIDQAGCDEDRGCSHRRALEYYRESIVSNNFIATPCSSYEEYKEGACSANEHVAMGEYTPLTVSGWYYLDTNGASPFAQGETDL